MASAVTQYLILLQPSHRQVRSRRRSPSPSPERARAVIDRRLRLRPQRQRRSPSASDSVIFVEDTPSDDEELPLGILPHNASLSRAGTGTSNVATGATSSRVAGPATLTVRGAGSSEPLGPITSADVEAWQKTLRDAITNRTQSDHLRIRGGDVSTIGRHIVDLLQLYYRRRRDPTASLESPGISMTSTVGPSSK